ncbi:MAG: two pore domain potassium channel family protein [Gammaproteobacteria bacterium]|nr:two pore domain potassium channel family protein [Gammaproteobacteria bacterium]
MILTLSISTALIFLCVGIHYEALYRFSSVCKLLKIKGRLKVVAGTLWALLAHTLEVWLFAIGYYWLVNKTTGSLIVDPNQASYTDFMDMVYFSFISYTSLGYGDLVPSGAIRFMAGTEALVGLVFIAWTASFLYLKMEHNWKEAD